MDISKLTNEQKLRNWKAFHKLEAEGTEQGDFAKRNFARKMIVQLRPFYTEFAGPQHTKTVATIAQPSHNQSATPAQPSSTQLNAAACRFSFYMSPISSR